MVAVGATHKFPTDGQWSLSSGRAHRFASAQDASAHARRAGIQVVGRGGKHKGPTNPVCVRKCGNGCGCVQWNTEATRHESSGEQLRRRQKRRFEERISFEDSDINTVHQCRIIKERVQTRSVAKYWRLGGCLRRSLHFNPQWRTDTVQTHGVNWLQSQSQALEVLQITVIENLVHDRDPTVPDISVVTGGVTFGARLSTRTIRAM